MKSLLRTTITASITLLALLACAVPAALEGQAAVGLRGGLRSAGLSSGQSTGTIAEPVFGAYLGFGLTDRLALQVEGVYGTRGGTGLGLGTDALDPGAAPVDLEMNYLEVPILLRVGFPGDRVLASFFAGPYAAFLLSCEVLPESGGLRSCDDAGTTQRFSPRSTDLGVLGGAGLDLALAGSTVFVDVRYSLGLLSLESGEDAFDARHNGLAVTAGLAVPLGR